MSQTASRAAPAKRIVIAGGGTAGWMAAASLSHRLALLDLDITLVESSQIGTVGVGEATVPAIRRYFQSLGLDAPAVMRATSGTAKLGICFEGWRAEGHRFFHSFGQYGIEAGGVAFHQLWARLQAAGERHPLDDYCLATQLAYAGAFTPAPQPARADFEIYDWAVHFDASAFAAMLRQFALARAVRHVDARIVNVERAADSGAIARLVLDNGAALEGDLFVDCSGFRGLLIQGALGAGYRDWRRWLPCDRAIALPCAPAQTENIAPYTRARAQLGGWTWRIPLQHRVGNGYVYCSEHVSDADAEARLRAELEGEALAEPNRLRFVAGVAERPWLHNCVALGLAGGFLEPLESTSITLIQAAIEKLIQLWPPVAGDPRPAAEFNRYMDGVYERIRDFIILHYSANGRVGEPLWDHCRAMPLPDTLSHRIDAFRAGGHLIGYDLESFFDASWLCMYEGFGILPERVSPWAERFPLEDLRRLDVQLRADIAQRARDAPPHMDFLRKQCGMHHAP